MLGMVFLGWTSTKQGFLLDSTYPTHRHFFNLCLLVPSADNLCKQFGPRSGPTKNVWHSDSVPERIFWKKKWFFEKNQQATMFFEAKIFLCPLSPLWICPWILRHRFCLQQNGHDRVKGIIFTKIWKIKCTGMDLHCFQKRRCLLDVLFL